MDFPSLADEIVKPRPDMMIKVGAFTVSKTSYYNLILIDFLLTVKAATLTFISGCGPAFFSAKEGKLGSIYNLVKT